MQTSGLVLAIYCMQQVLAKGNVFEKQDTFSLLNSSKPHAVARCSFTNALNLETYGANIYCAIFSLHNLHVLI